MEAIASRLEAIAIRFLKVLFLKYVFYQQLDINETANVFCFNHSSDMASTLQFSSVGMPPILVRFTLLSRKLGESKYVWGRWLVLWGEGALVTWQLWQPGSFVLTRIYMGSFSKHSSTTVQPKATEICT